MLTIKEKKKNPKQYLTNWNFKKKNVFDTLRLVLTSNMEKYVLLYS